VFGTRVIRTVQEEEHVLNVCFLPDLAVTFAARNVGHELHGDGAHCRCNTCILCRAVCPSSVLQFPAVDTQQQLALGCLMQENAS
jgi:hypothetical protein